jgi:hypothetical protein
LTASTGTDPSASTSASTSAGTSPSAGAGAGADASGSAGQWGWQWQWQASGDGGTAHGRTINDVISGETMQGTVERSEHHLFLLSDAWMSRFKRTESN